MKQLVGLFLFGATLCLGQQPLIQAAGGPDEISFSQIEVGVDSPIKTSGVTVITDQEHWNAFVTKMNDDNLKKPKIDWTKYQIVVATLEGSTKDGVALQLHRLHKTAKGTDIEFQLSKDNSGSRFNGTQTDHNTLGKATFPYAIIQAPKFETKWNIKVLD